LQLIRHFLVATTLDGLSVCRCGSGQRTFRFANPDWGAIALADDIVYQAATRKDLEILDRVGGGDSFASGLIFGLLDGRDLDWAVECGVAHGALAMTTPGDTSMATLPEVLATMKGQSARISR
jgi:2-dehydro-3-deoxygluconokinase